MPSLNNSDLVIFEIDIYTTPEQNAEKMVLYGHTGLNYNASTDGIIS